MSKYALVQASKFDEYHNGEECGWAIVLQDDDGNFVSRLYGESWHDENWHEESKELPLEGVRLEMMSDLVSKLNESLKVDKLTALLRECKPLIVQARPSGSYHFSVDGRTLADECDRAIARIEAALGEGGDA